jgi:hypothetical protein
MDSSWPKANSAIKQPPNLSAERLFGLPKTYSVDDGSHISLA